MNPPTPPLSSDEGCDDSKMDILRKRQSRDLAATPEGKLWLNIYEASLTAMRGSSQVMPKKLGLVAATDAAVAVVAWNMYVGDMHIEKEN